ncbi:hypothetical protein ES703_115615 [subsurface metagenome]
MPDGNAVEFSNCFTDFNQLLLVGVAAREIIKTGGKPNGSLPHPLRHQRLHSSHFLSGGGAVDKAHCFQSQSVVGYEVGDINRYFAVETGKEFTDRAPVPGDVWIAVQTGEVAPHHPQVIRG